MDAAKQADSFFEGIGEFVTTPTQLRSVFIFVIALILAYWLSKFLALGIIRLAQIVAVRSDNESNALRVTRLRQTETYLSIAVAIVRTIFMVAVALVAWRMLSPYGANNSIAAIGAGTVFVVIAGQTIGLVLRDLTTGAVMITEGWYKIGDFIKIEPFGDVAGVVEQFTLRSTKIRALNGEIIRVHNQQIMAVHITPYGVRTLAVDVFVRDKDKGIEAINKIIAAIPKGKTMLAKPLKITETEEWGENRWRITVTGQTAPGREWLIENFFVQSINELDEGKEGADKLVALPPMPRNADEGANRHFRRAVRVQHEQERADTK